MIKRVIKQMLTRRGYAHVGEGVGWPDIEPEFHELYKLCKPYTLTSLERMYALYRSVIYLHKNNVTGDIVECGVWKGGSVMMIALTLARLGAVDRKIYMYDTYEGMSKPSDKDVNLSGVSAQDKWDERVSQGGTSNWLNSSLDEVKRNVSMAEYPDENLVYVQGMVEDTIPEHMPDAISLLRLDTDLYESTYHELAHLYPAVVNGGVLIIDDYGHWRGSREATDQYIREQNLPIFLNRIDYAGRLVVKCEGVGRR